MRKLYLLLFVFIMISCSNENTLKFNKGNYGKEWPFSVEEIEVYCGGYKEIYCKASNGKTYALNGSAIGTSKDNPEINKIEEIWLDDPKFDGLKISYSQFITEGLKLCENK